MNYLTKPPPPADEYYYEEDTYAVPKAPLNRIGAMVKEIKVRTMEITTDRAIMFGIETTTATTTSIRVTMVTKMNKVVPMFYLKIRKLLQGMVEVAWREFKICYRR